MDKKYTVTQAFMNELVKWRDHGDIDATNGGVYAYLGAIDIEEMPHVVGSWWTTDDDPIACNNRLVAIINWLNGDEVFEIDKRHMFIVCSKEPDKNGEFVYVVVNGCATRTSSFLSNATKFNTYEQAKEWANSHQAIIEIDSDGNYV